MRKQIQKSIKSFDKIFVEEINKEIEDRMDEIIDLYMLEYDMQLVAPVIDRKSRTNPGLPKYVDAYREALQEHEFIVEEEEEGVLFKLRLPNMENLNFSSGVLKVIQNILEGATGVFVEVDAEQYEQMYQKQPVGLEAYDDTARKKDMIYIIRYTADVRRRERSSLDEELVRYPFSNTPPIDIFEEPNRYIKENIGRWAFDALQRTKRKFKQQYRG